MPADTIRRLAREFAAAPTGALYGRIGLCNQEFGTLASWLVDVVNIVVGKFDRPGGLMWGKPIAWPMAWMASTAKDGPPRFGRWTSRVSGVPEVLGQVPAAFLAEEIATPGDGQIKVLFTVAGNPVISVPDSARLEAALPELECMISVDNYLNETDALRRRDPARAVAARDAALRRAALGLGGAQRRQLERRRSSRRRADRPHEGQHRRPPRLAVHRRDERGLRLRVARRRLVRRAVPIAGTRRRRDRSRATTTAARSASSTCTVRTGPWGDRYGEVPDGLTLEQIKAQPHGIDMGPMVPRADEMVCTPDGLIDLAPEYIVGDLPRLRARIARRPTTASAS